MTSSKKCETYPNHDVNNQKPHNQNSKFFLVLNYGYKTFHVFRGFEKLSSSIGW